jgi:uncharacterized protein YcbX
MSAVQLCGIQIFPIKSLDGVPVEQARIVEGGFLEHDRVYAMMDDDGKYVNGKRVARVHQLRCAYNADYTEVGLWPTGGQPTQFCLKDTGPIDQWLSDFFGFHVTLRYDPKNGFPDDREAFGPTIVSDASLAAIQKWYPTLTLESIRRRFRANLEISGGPPFCEDELFGAPGELKPFAIGQVKFHGHNPCQRCAVPTRDPDTGEAIHEFQKSFMQLRKEHLPTWSNAARFNHYYRFAINTSIPPTESGKTLRIGDEVNIGAVR